MCWGANASGQLGDGTIVDRSQPAMVQGPDLHAITAGAQHTCGLDADARAWCWGDNAKGQLAVDSVITTPRLTPARAADSLTFATLAAGETGFTCGVSVDGSAWCWGHGSDGQLGIGTRPDAHILPAVLADSAGDTLRFQRLRVGWAHSCGITPAGDLACWGTSRLGRTQLYQAVIPVVVLPGVTEVTLGGLHTCALERSGQAVCWGGGQDGALGTGNRTSHDLPQPVALQLGVPPG